MMSSPWIFDWFKDSGYETFNNGLAFVEIAVKIDNVVAKGLAVFEGTTINGMAFFAQDGGLGARKSVEN